MMKTNKEIIERELVGLRAKLLDTGFRNNRMMHVNRENRRANCLNVIHEKSDEIFKRLRVEEKRMRFKAMGHDKAEENGWTMSLAAPDDESDEGRGRLTDNFIETPLGPEALAKRLLRLATDAKILEEEQGLNVLYLAMGFLRWKESASSAIERNSPLMLLPVQLVRNGKTSTFDVQCRDDEIAANPNLQERLRQDFGIDLPEAEEKEDWRPSTYFAEAADAVSGQPGWSIDEDGMQLGFFSFAKILMHRDLDPSQWPDDAFSKNPLLSGLLAGGFPDSRPRFASEDKGDVEEDKLDDRLDPANVIQIIDADASQTKAIEEVRRKFDLVIQGPPGTGKSQTIANIIAAAVHDGKSVLFVAEKMAALSVVHNRLVKAGLRNICLELHSRKANKKALAQELGRTLDAGDEEPSDAVDPASLRQARDALNRISCLLHDPLDGRSDTPFQTLSELIGFIGQEAKPPKIDGSDLGSLGPEERSKTRKAIKDLEEALERSGAPDEHPFRGIGALDLQPPDLSRLEGELQNAIAALDRLIAKADDAADVLNRQKPNSFNDVRRICSELNILGEAPPEALSLVSDLFEPAGRPRFREVLEVGAIWAEAKWRGKRTSFSTFLSAARWLEKVREAGFSSAQDISDALEAMDDPAVGDPVAMAAEIFELMEKAQERCAAPMNRLNLDLQRAVDAQCLEDAPMAELREAFNRMNADVSRYNEWIRLVWAFSKVRNCGAGGIGIAEAVGAGRLEAGRAETEFAYACAEARWKVARQERPELDELGQCDRHALSGRFQELEREQFKAVRTLIRSRHFKRLPRGADGEMRIIRGEIERMRGHKPIRWVMGKAGLMVQRIKPVMLMSPISVAQFLPPDVVKFDILVIDEASQVRPQEAIGAIARADRIVVVGDQKQLPPTSFFDRLTGDAEDEDEDEEGESAGAAAGEMESILSLCEARGFRQRMLEWHYRSRDPSLIRISNAEFYEDRLVLPPSPLQPDSNYGFRFRRVPGVYARSGSGLGRAGTNRIEAEKVVEAMSRHARDWPKFSLGVVTFSKTQADMLTEVLELRRRNDGILDGFLRENKAEDVFVKNIENVQGDERDVIMISVGYGPQEANGRLASMRFGPINNEGGERRLNVLFSRARFRCEVFASFDPGDIDLSRTSAKGVSVLKRFLDFAETGDMEAPKPTGRDAESPFEEDVARVIESLGYLADPQVGDRGFRIDIGVRRPERPGQYLVAVECDGKAYHSALWARERDRLRQEVLEGFGWKFHRIWSTDWYHNRKPEIERLKDALEEACRSSSDGVHVRGSNAEKTGIAEAQETEDETANAASADSERIHLLLRDAEDEIANAASADSVTFETPSLKASAYVRANFMIDPPSQQPHETSIRILADLVAKIVGVEGPIHKDEIARRVTSAFGLSRTGNRIVEATDRAIRSATRGESNLEKKGPFVFTSEQFANPPVRDRSAESGASLMKAEYLPPMEISAAAKRISAECGNMSLQEMTGAVARLLGYRRVGQDLHDAITAALRSD